MPLVQGWLLDGYPSKDGSGMTFWLKTPDNRALKFKDSRWRAKIYASGGACFDRDYLRSRIDDHLIHSINYASKRSDFFHLRRSRVLEIELENASKIRKLAESLERAFQNPDYLQLYNVDLLPEQQYFYEHDLFPLGFVEADTKDGEVTRWSVLDSIAKYDYQTPSLKTLRVGVGISDCVPRLDSKLCSIELSSPDQEEQIARIEGKSEAAILSEAMAEVEKFDPDLVITRNGDSFVLPFLYSKAARYGVESIAKFDRDEVSRSASQKTGGKTYFSYGRILYRPATQRLFGRLHLDEQNTFIYDQCMLEGLYEVSRLCRIPLHTSMRASIGKCLASLQSYYATKEDILIPWKPETVEDTKNAYDLFVADRGGLVMKPLPGVHEHVGEVDFASLYPSIIRKYNISAETVNCPCCQDSKFQIEELGMHVCERREGIIARSLVLPLDKRFEYKRLRDSESDEKLKKVYNERAGSLKWILVCCLAKESTVLIQRNGQTKLVKIGDFIDSCVGNKVGIVDSPESVCVAGIDSELKSKFCKVKKLLKIPNQQKLLSVVMDDGRKIVVTPNHPCYLLKEGNLVVRRASELKEGNFIPVAKQLPSTTRDAEFIDIIDQLPALLDQFELGKWRVSGTILSQAILEHRETVLREVRNHGYSDQIIRVWIKKGVIPLRFFHLLSVPRESHKDLRIGIGRIKGKFGIISWMPAVVPVNEDLGFFLGLYASDGSTTDSYIRFDVGYFETDLLETICKISETLFQLTPRVYKENNVNVFVVRLNNLALTKFMEYLLDIPRASEKGKLKVPQLVLDSQRIVAKGFLEGMLAGDGSINKGGTFASIATVSKDFANQIGFLGAMLNLGFRIATHSRTSIYPMYTVNFLGPETLKEISRWKYLKQAHRAILDPKLESLCNSENLNCTHPSYQLFPTDESGIVLLARKVRTVRTPRIDQRNSACPYRIVQTIEKIAFSKRLEYEPINSFTNIKRMFHGDLGFVRIRKIEQLNRADEYVYCFQLDNGEVSGFFAGDGAVFTHNCFGYLSYRNAKFGKIDSHIAVCSIARKTLVEAMHTAEYSGFRVVHGIVDSLWLSKRNADLSDYEELRESIENNTGFKLAIEGIYKWIVFLPSKTYSKKQVANRYFGAFEGTNALKVRGIELRRHDAPLYFKRCQEKILNELAKCDNERELKECARWKCVEIFEEFAKDLEDHKARATELIITRRLSKNPSEYSSQRQLSVNAASHLAKQGLELKAGQSVSYVITSYKSHGKERSIPEEEISSEIQEYDSERYVELLADCCASVLSPLGVSKEELLTRSLSLTTFT